MDFTGCRYKSSILSAQTNTDLYSDTDRIPILLRYVLSDLFTNSKKNEIL